MNLDPKTNRNRVKRIIQAWQQETDRPLSKALGSGKPENKTVPFKSLRS